MGAVPRICKGAGRRGRYADASKRSGSVHIDDIEVSVTFVQVLQAVGKEDVTVIFCHKPGHLLRYQFSQPIVAYIPAIMLNSAGEKVSLSRGP